MPVQLRGVTYYRTAEALDRIGISRATFYRWLAVGRILDSKNRDRNGQRIFTEHEIEALSEITEATQSQPKQTVLPLRR